MERGKGFEPPIKKKERTVYVKGYGHVPKEVFEECVVGEFLDTDRLSELLSERSDYRATVIASGPRRPVEERALYLLRNWRPEAGGSGKRKEK